MKIKFVHTTIYTVPEGQEDEARRLIDAHNSSDIGTQDEARDLLDQALSDLSDFGTEETEEISFFEEGSVEPDPRD